jgi:mannose-6-phosphate isomerase
VNTICLLENTVKEYEWGSRSFIQGLLGKRGSLYGCAAELWVGTHPLGPSRALLPEGPVSLKELINRHSEQVLGDAPWFPPEGGLPFLFKIIAAERPLSIQVHPDKKRAREGFMRENLLGLPLDSPRRSYKDESHKPELVCALSSFKALAGFRPAEEAIALCSRLGMEALAVAWEGTAGMFQSLVAGHNPASREIVDKACRSAGSIKDEDPCFSWIVRLSEQYPSDPGCLAPLFLNLVTLMPGEALYIPPGYLHSYLEGCAVEVMACSDNVIRGGLTNKYIDLEELLAVMRRDEVRPCPILPDPAGQLEGVYRVPAEEFLLSVLHISGDACYEARRGRCVEILFCLEGGGVIGKETGESTLFGKGDCLLVPASVPSYTIKGDAKLYKVTLPLPP